MKLRMVPFFILVMFGIPKLALVLQTYEVVRICAWFLGSAGMAWNCWAYWKDRDMIGRSVSFDFRSGENQTMRTIYVVSLVAAYVSAAWLG